GQEHRQDAAVAVGVYQPGRAPLAHVAEVGQGQRGVVHGNRHRLAVKVAGGDDVYRAAFLVYKDKRVIVHGVQIDIEHPLEIGDGAAHGAMHLGYAAQRIGVLNVGRGRVAQQFAALQQAAQEGGVVNLPGVGADGVHAG